MDDLSDRTLWENSKEMATIFKESFMVYLIPSVYGIEIDLFQGDKSEYESVNGEQED